MGLAHQRENVRMCAEDMGNLNINVLNVFFQAVLNQKFIDCFVLVFLDSQAGKTVSYLTNVLRTFIHFSFVNRPYKFTFPFSSLLQSLKVVFREPLPPQAQPSSSPPPQLVSMYHHLESVINTACYNLWTGLL